MNLEESCEKASLDLLAIANQYPQLFNVRRFEPHYSTRADYNTNAKSYYDYLARYNYMMGIISDMLQRLLNRDLSVTDSNTIDFTKTGDWKSHGECCKYDDEIDLTGNVKLSDKKVTKTYDELKPKTYTLGNAISVDGNKGLFAVDYDAVLKALNDVIGDIKDQIKQIIDSISVNGKIEVPRKISTSNNPQLINKVDLGDITDDTRISITWSEGSTRRTDDYTVRDLKKQTAHITGQNLTDDGDSAWTFEAFTRIVDGNKLWITTLHSYRTNSTGDITWVGKSWDETTGLAYYDTQNPDYVNQAEGQDHITIQYITVWDLIDPITIG